MLRKLEILIRVIKLNEFLLFTAMTKIMDG